MLGNGVRFGARLHYSRETAPLEVAGGIATALPLLGDGVALVVSADVYVEYDYASLRPRLAAMEASTAPPHLHMVMVPNPAYHPGGDFVLENGRLALDGAPRLTFGNIALYRTSLFAEPPRGEKRNILPRGLDRGLAAVRPHTGRWANVGSPAELVASTAADGEYRLHTVGHERNHPITVNPLLDFSGLPHFDRITPEHVSPAIDALIAVARTTIDQVATLNAEPTWDNFVTPLADALDRLGQAWGQVGHLNAVVNTPELREAYNVNLPKITSCYTDFGQDERLFARYRALASASTFAALDIAQRKLVDNTLRDFRLSGAELPPDKKARLKAVDEELASLSSRYEDNVLDATNAWGLLIDDAATLAGVPSDVLAAARQGAAADSKRGWKLSLRMPCYLPVMQYAETRSLRETLYRAYATRASEFGNAEWDNSKIIERVLELRREAAELLGYASYAEVSLVPKMARTPTEVLAFLRDLAVKARPFAERDMAELEQFARDELGMPDLAAWDLPYVSEKLREARYSFSDQEVKQYFPEDRVLAGMFRVVETIFGVAIRESRAAVWHPSVRFFDVVDRAGEVVGQFYLDLYARPGKRGGAWMDDAINRRRRDTRVQHPVAYLTCIPAPSTASPRSSRTTK
jgi:Zn-dependent oligopeptidase